jgi:prepilin-type N-terminal cleavage/methylation domain-containing protein
MRSAFTLIELLIVVAIIAILAAIAVPNFMEAQVRAKVSRVKNDFRTIVTACESYAVDFNKYPGYMVSGYMITNLVTPGSSITSPVAYLSSVPLKDEFRVERPDQNNPEGYYQYFWYNDDAYTSTARRVVYRWQSLPQIGYPPRNAFSLVSWGPGRSQSQGEHLEYAPDFRGYIQSGNSIGATGPELYDATNGTISNGDIVRFGGGTQSIYGSTP